MTFSFNVPQNGPEINLPSSRAQRTFARAVYDELTVVLGADTIAYLTLTKHLHQRRLTLFLLTAARGTSDDRY
jgi:hypothetical protein